MDTNQIDLFMSDEISKVLAFTPTTTNNKLSEYPCEYTGSPISAEFSISGTESPNKRSGEGAETKIPKKRIPFSFFSFG